MRKHSGYAQARSVAVDSMRGNAVLQADSTQTVRALTQAELNDRSLPQWYVVELAVSSRPINLDMMPRLDVFAAHPLYCITRQQGTPEHSLRLGFFNDVKSAQKICDVVRTLFPCSSVARVSDAEHARFTTSPAPKPTAPNVAPVNTRFVQAEPTRSTSARSAVSLNDGKSRIPSPLRTPESAESHPSAAIVSDAKPVPTPAARQVAVTKPPAQRAATAKAGATKPKSLAAQLMDEAREIQKSQTGKHRAVVPERSWLSRLFGARR